MGTSVLEKNGFRDAKELLFDVRILYVAPFLLSYMQIPSKIVKLILEVQTIV